MKRYKKTNTHHRKPRSMQGTNEPENLSKVNVAHHVAYHTLFGAGDPYYIAKYLNDVWIDPEYYLIVVKRKKEKDKNQLEIHF